MKQTEESQKKAYIDDFNAIVKEFNVPEEELTVLKYCKYKNNQTPSASSLKYKPMKSNRKNRKLDFIKKKNRLRQGKDIVVFYKVANDVFKSNNVSTLIDSVTKEYIQQIKDVYKQDVKVKCFETNQSNDDFMQDQTTLHVTLNKFTTM